MRACSRRRSGRSLSLAAELTALCASVPVAGRVVACRCSYRVPSLAGLLPSQTVELTTMVAKQALPFTEQASQHQPFPSAAKGAAATLSVGSRRRSICSLSRVAMQPSPRTTFRSPDRAAPQHARHTKHPVRHTRRRTAKRLMSVTNQESEYCSSPAQSPPNVRPLSHPHNPSAHAPPPLLHLSPPVTTPFTSRHKSLHHASQRLLSPVANLYATRRNTFCRPSQISLSHVAILLVAHHNSPRLTSQISSPRVATPSVARRNPLTMHRVHPASYRTLESLPSHPVHTTSKKRERRSFDRRSRL